MPHFKAPDNTLHFLSDEDVANGGTRFLPVGFKKISDAQALSMLPKPSENDLLKVQIAELEATVTPRRLREAILSQDGADWLAAVESEISALRKKLV